MKLIDKILIKSFKHDTHIDVRNFLQEKLNNKKLTTQQIWYLIKNMNVNTYMLQNIYPVADAIEKGISIEVIEECASLLDDALNLSLFSLENGKDKLYNKVPYDLEHFLQLDCVKEYSDCKRISFDSGYVYDKIQQISFCLYQNNKLKTISYELFWQLVNNIDNIYYISKYNKNVSEYLKKNNDIHIFRIDELLEIGMNLFEISLFDYEKIDNLVEILENTKKEISNDMLEYVDFKLTDESYILQVTSQEPVGLMMGVIIDGKVEEVSIIEQPPVKTCLFYNPTCEEDYIVESDRCFDLLLAKFSQHIYQLEKDIHYTMDSHNSIKMI